MYACLPTCMRALYTHMCGMCGHVTMTIRHVSGVSGIRCAEGMRLVRIAEPSEWHGNSWLTEYGFHSRS